MHFSRRSTLSILLSLFAITAVIGGYAVIGARSGQTTQAHAAAPHASLNCASNTTYCTEVADSEAVFGQGNYVGHDEPSTLFYSNVPGSGNRMSWQLQLPKDPTPTAPTTLGKSYNFELHPTFWFGMAMCDTQSYPELLSACTPDSDKNIVDPALSPNHPGTAFMEMQFYAPGWVPHPFTFNSCDPTKWCAAINIDSLLENPVTGQIQNSTCLTNFLGGNPETVNFAFITKNGVPQPNSPPNPIQSTITTFTPDHAADLFMNSGDQLGVTFHDTAHGLQVLINDKSTHQSGSMTASAANGFGQVVFDPTGTTCNNHPYNFHPMYSTSSELTRVPWAAHTYNISFADEIGHFDFCNGSNPITPGGVCPAGNTEGTANDQEPTDANDFGCFPASSSSLVKVAGCIGTNDPGFDGIPYQPVWPDGNTKLHPTAVRFSSPLTGQGYNINYSRVGFESNTPRLEVTAGTCNRDTSVGCTIIPVTDDGFPAAFYPFFSIAKVGGQCVWQLGNHIPGSSNDFGQDGQYGTLLNPSYTLAGGGGAPITFFEDYRQILSHNPCAA